MRLSKYEKNILRNQKRKAALGGKGLFVFRNNTSGELFLPRATKSGITRVAEGDEFQGDDYYMFMVRNNELRLVRQIEPANPPPVINEQVEPTMADKLITEQPPVVTNEGTVEWVEKPIESEKKKLNESQPDQQGQQDILLNENPMDGIEII